VAPAVLIAKLFEIRHSRNTIKTSHHIHIMGGDGGVIASNRKFMRGAGTADLTADFNHHAKEKVKHNAQDAMTTCALTKTPLLHVTSTNSATINTNTHTIVADPYGRLYHKEAAVHALLKRKRQAGDGDDSAAAADTIGPQVRRMNDLYDVRFHFDNNSSNVTPSCPITGKALTGSISAILLVSTTKSDGPNVVSESALKQLSMDELQEEYGCIQRKVRLAPDPTLLETIKEQVQKEHDKDEEERNAKKAAKKKNKRKLRDDGGGSDNNKIKKRKEKKDTKAIICTKATAKAISSSSSSLGQQVQSRVDSAIKKNTIYSSIFVDKSLSSKISEKEKKDNLFAR
ncbi:MAG: hypothetical protein ACI90V_011373, partial [Bacillariaceae sp.]|jgi:hypothetical protein